MSRQYDGHDSTSQVARNMVCSNRHSAATYDDADRRAIFLSTHSVHMNEPYTQIFLLIAYRVPTASCFSEGIDI